MSQSSEFTEVQNRKRNEFSLLANKVSENAVSERSHQSTQESYFITE
jgi:hypothetical protein